MEAPKVQHVTKASSDELLRKFAAMDDSDSEAQPSPASAKRRKTLPSRNKNKKKKKKRANPGDQVEEGNNINNGDESPVGMSMRKVERKSLLPQYYQRGLPSRSRRQGHRGSRQQFRTKSVFTTIQKTWCKAVRGASKVFMEKHYNRHRLLASDMV